MAVPLMPAEVLVVSGADATAFAQAQFTSDVTALHSGQWQWSAWLDPQGRVRFFFALLHVEPLRWLVWLPFGGAESMRYALGRFVLRAAVKLEALTDWTLHGLGADELEAPLSRTQVVARHGGFAFAQPGRQRLAWIAPGGSTQYDRPALERWRMDDVAAGLPLLAPELGGEFVAQALDLERVDAIRFDKGCYPGQEIAARLHFRGGNKRHLRHLRIDAPAPAAGTPVVDEEKNVIGRVLYAANAGAGTSKAIGVLLDANATTPGMTCTGAKVHVLARQE